MIDHINQFLLARALRWSRRVALGVLLATTTPMALSTLPRVLLSYTGTSAVMPTTKHTLLESRPSGGPRAVHAETQRVSLAQEPATDLTFVVTSDMRYFSGAGEYDSASYFRGACQTVTDIGRGAFMVVPGDPDPVGKAEWSIAQVVGAEYRWYPIVGNHELPGRGVESYSSQNLEWIRAHDHGVVNGGPGGFPETTYSFDFGIAHFVVLNEYCDTAGDSITDGDMPDHLFDWLAQDLQNTISRYVFIIEHEPAYPQADADNGRLRHSGDSLDKYPVHRDRYWNLLRTEGVVAYICGHNHNYSAVPFSGVWQIDAGHSRGLGDTGARSTIIFIDVSEEAVTFRTYRDDASSGLYTLFETGTLTWERADLPAVSRTNVHALESDAVRPRRSLRRDSVQSTAHPVKLDGVMQ
jgi:hypothetical protein